MKLRFSIRDLLLLTLIVAVLVWGGLWFFRSQQPVDPFPLLSDIESIDARFYRSGFKTFSVPKSDWQRIFDAMRPAILDNEPASWALLGDLQINLIRGGGQNIQLFHGPPGSGAFKINGTYYLGGDTVKLKASLFTAESQMTSGTAVETQRTPADPDFVTVPAD